MYLRKIFLGIVFLGLLIGIIFTYRFYYVFFADNTNFATPTKTVYIQTGISFDSLLIALKPIIKSSKNFTLAANKKGYINNIKAGKFRFEKGMNNNEIINILRLYNSPIKLTFNNQERLENLAKRVAQQIEADSISLMNVFLEKSFLEKNDFTSDNAMTMYIPNTYEFFWNTSAEKFRNIMLREYKRFWNKTRIEKAKEINLTLQEVYILASIVNKETSKISERPQIAGVYLNRLKKKMKLQADPTVIYALKKKYNNNDTIFKRVLYKDLKTQSPYNTYLNNGLPIGPITMPDISSINAVLNAAEHDYIYFVADTERIGYHLFAKTLKQHNKNKKKYTRWLNRKKLYR